MSKHTVCGLAGKRLEVRPSPTSPGHVLVQLLGADRQVVSSVTFDPAAAAVAGMALANEALAAELDQARIDRTMRADALAFPVLGG